MTDTASAHEIEQWAESLRDKVSRLTGRTLEGVRGVDSELRGDLLDAIDLVLESARDPVPVVDPSQQMLEKLADELQEFAASFPAKLSDHSQATEESVVSRLGEQFEETRSAFDLSSLESKLDLLGHRLTELESKDDGLGGFDIEEQFLRLRGVIEASTGSQEAYLKDFVTKSEEAFQSTSDRLQELDAKITANVESEGGNESEAVQELASRLEQLSEEIGKQRAENESLQYELQKSAVELVGAKRESAAVLEEARVAHAAALEAAEASASSDTEVIFAPIEDSQEDSILRERIRVLETELEESRAELEDALQASPTAFEHSVGQADCEEDGEGGRSISLVSRTELALQERDRRIDSLLTKIKELERSESESLNATPQESVLNADEVVQEERTKLATLQEEWRDKIRNAEIDLSKERANLARERREIEAELEVIRRKSEVEQGGKTRKWLDQLGLRDDVTTEVDSNDTVSADASAEETQV
ncbi:MAG: hypothetical protein AB8B50_04775 [Pirellulaceae bacterium]